MVAGTALFKELLEEYRGRIDEKLSNDTADRVFKDIGENAFMKRYLDAFNTYTEGGKRLRAFLVILGYNLCGRETDEDIVTASLSYELFQSGVLIHDDIIDESDLRRNKPSMHVTLGNDKDGISKAICVGDLGILAASDAILITGFEDELKTKAIESLHRVFKLTIAGEIKDIELASASDYTMDDIIKMYELKTSWYTLIGPLELGLILGRADEELLETFKEAGKDLGIAFQIRDDILGIYGASETTGKSVVSDIEEGKKTVLTSYFEAKASYYNKEEFHSIYGKGKCDSSGAEVIGRLLEESGARGFAEGLCREYTDKAVELINKTDISERYREVLFGLIEYMNDRAC